MSCRLPRLAMLALACAPLAAIAQAFPTKALRIVDAYAPGGGTDALARMLAPRLAEVFGQSVIVDNRPGVDGILGTEIVARATPDGHTFLIVPTAHAINASIGRKLPYDTLRDFAPIAQVINLQLVLVVHPSVPVKTVRELVDHLKAQSGRLNYGSSSIGSALPMELFKNLTGTRIQHVPYKGSGPMLIDLIGGHVQLAMAGAVAAMPHIRTGKLVALGIGDAKRTPFFPDVPTVAEAGVPGYQAVGWTGLFAPAKTPRAVVARLNGEIVRILRTPEFTERVANMGAEIVTGTPEEWGAFVAGEIRKWSEVARASGFKSE